MTNLSPQAQVVLDAMYEVNMDFNDENYALAAAALRAVAMLDEIQPEALGLCDERYGDWERIESISQRDYMYNLAKSNKKVKVAVLRRLHSIAAELEGSND